jgi:peptide/nickel transport system permease protein
MRRLPTKAVVGFTVLAVVIACAALAPWIAPYDPNDQDILNSLAPPLAIGDGGMHLLGTDRIGQDILSRIIYGARVSLFVAFGAAGASALIGVPLGMAAAFLGRAVESVVLVLADMILSIPFILFALVVMSVLGASLPHLVIAFATVRWAQFARVSYALSLELRDRDFIVACRAGGIGLWRTLTVHVLPNMLGPIIVIATLELAFAILMESGLSFLGLGAPPEAPSWGGLLQEGRDELDTAWWITVAPGLAIMATTIGWNFLGDWLRDKTDPRLQGALR